MNKQDIDNTIHKLKTPLIKKAGVALKDRVDHISIMVPLEMVVKILIINIKFYVLLDTK